VRSWSESEAERIAEPINVTIAQNGDGYEVRPSGYDLSNSRIGVDLEVAIPKKSVLSIKTDKGDVTVSGNLRRCGNHGYDRRRGRARNHGRCECGDA